MIKSTPLPKFMAFAILPLAALFAASCGSYQQASYYDDGIYSSGNRVVHVEKKSAEAVRLEDQESNLYGDYFGDKANEYGEILDEEIFTDVDSYSSQTQNDSIPYGEQTDYFAYNNTYNGNPGWGDNPTSLTINVYDNWGWGGYYGWNSPYWGFGYGWGGYPYYNWGWYSPWRYNRWGWGGYYGWGYPYYGSWGYAGYWGWGGYYNYGWRPYYYNNYYGRNYAYSRGRRGYSSSTIPGTSLRGRSNLASRTSGYTSRYRTDSGRSNRSVGASRTSRSYRSGTTARRTVSPDAIARNRNYRTSRSTRTSPNYRSSSRTYRSYGTSPSSRSSGTYSRSGSVNRSSSSPTYRSSGRSTRSYQSSPRTSAPSRSNYNRSSRSSGSSSYRSSGSGSYRSSGSRSSSSGSYRSSGGSSRSSGGASRSGGSSRSGRGNGRN